MKGLSLFRLVWERRAGLEKEHDECWVYLRRWKYSQFHWSIEKIGFWKLSLWVRSFVNRRLRLSGGTFDPSTKDYNFKWYIVGQNLRITINSGGKKQIRGGWRILNSKLRISCQKRNSLFQEGYCRYDNDIVTWRKNHQRRCNMKVSQGILCSLEYHNLPSKKTQSKPTSRSLLLRNYKIQCFSP